MNLRCLNVDGSIHPVNDAGLHVSAPTCQGKVLSRLPWRRNQAELLQEAQSIPLLPVFKELPSSQAGDGDARLHSPDSRPPQWHDERVPCCLQWTCDGLLSLDVHTGEAWLRWATGLVDAAPIPASTMICWTFSGEKNSKID